MINSTRSDVYPLFKDVDSQLAGEPCIVAEDGVIFEATSITVDDVNLDARAVHAAGASLASTMSGKRFVAIEGRSTNWTAIEGRHADLFECETREKAGL